MILYPKRSSSVHRVETQFEPYILCQLRSLISSLDQNEMRNFGQSIHNNPYRIISFRGARQSSNEVHTNLCNTPGVTWARATLTLEAVVTRSKGLGQHLRTWRPSANNVANDIRSITLILAHLLPWIRGEKNPRPLLNPIFQNPK
jgi:hypothetical protein